MLVALAAAGLVACSKKEESTTVGQKLDSVIATTEKKADQAASAAATGVGQAKEAVKEAAQDAKEATKTATAAVSDALSDAAITTAVNVELAKDAALSALKINVDTSAGGKVKLTGTAPTAAARDHATELAKSVKGVSTVDNQLRVGDK